MSNNKVGIIKRIFEYYQDGYFALGIDYLRNHGFLNTMKKSKYILSKKQINPVRFTDGQSWFEVNPVGSKKRIKLHDQAIDIIICVHNAYDDVKRCLESVMEYTSEPYRIIVVDDGSQEQTRNYLFEISQKYINKIYLIRNDGKHGYAIAANIGMRNSKAAFFVLLNSDTIVTDGWLDRMYDCMQSSSEIGIVGPISNTASWQSVPRLQENGDWCHNDLPYDNTVDEMGKLVAKYSGNIYLNVPLLNGFCMMVSKTVVENIGYFDEENFGEGFGEEDDFNLRALNKGYKLAIADNVYIYHAQSKSYSDHRRKELCALSGEKVRGLHGADYLEQCVVYMKDNLVLEGIRLRVEAFLEREKLIKDAKGKWSGKKILFHLPCAEAGGGANVIIQEAERLLEIGIEVKIYNLEVNRRQFESSYPELKIPVIYGPDYSGFLKFVSGFDVICVTYYKGVQYCKIKDKYPNIKVVYYIQDFEPYFFKKGSKMYRDALNSYNLIEDMILVTKTLWNQDIVKKMTGRVCQTLGPSVNVDLFRPRKAFLNQETIGIAAMVRPSSPRRAPEMTMRVLKQIKERYQDKIKVYIFGCDQEEYRDFFEKIDASFDYKNLGIVTPIQMSGLLSNVDIFVDFSTFQAMGLTGMEAMASGCAVILPKKGGASEFADNEKNCLLIDTESEQICYEQLSRLINEERLREKLAYQALKDMCKYYPERCTYRLLECIFD